MTQAFTLIKTKFLKKTQHSSSKCRVSNVEMWLNIGSSGPIELTEPQVWISPIQGSTFITQDLNHEQHQEMLIYKEEKIFPITTALRRTRTSSTEQKWAVIQKWLEIETLPRTVQSFFILPVVTAVRIGHVFVSLQEVIVMRNNGCDSNPEVTQWLWSRFPVLPYLALVPSDFCLLSHTEEWKYKTIATLCYEKQIKL